MINKKSTQFICSIVLGTTSLVHAAPFSTEKHPLYVGFIGGYGSTTWQGLVADEKDKNVALMMSTPSEVEEGGATWGALVGYEFTPNFAVEANYLKYPSSTVYFDQYSIFSFTHTGQGSLTTHTQTGNLMAKIMLPIANTNFRVYSSLGAALLYRKDIIEDSSRISPTFGGGINYNFTERLMGELVGNYTAGYGQSQLSPADSFYPFLYSVTARIALRI